MFDTKHYVPALKWRQGEYGALSELSSDQKKWITPLIDIPNIPWDYEEERPAKTIDNHLSKIAVQMAAAWGTEDPIFVDCNMLDADVRMESLRHPVDELFEALASEGVRAIPVISPDSDAAFRAAVAIEIARHGRGVCVRAGTQDVKNADARKAISELITMVGADVSETDFILDLRSIAGSKADLLEMGVTTALDALEDQLNYRTLTLLCGAFPINMSNIQPGIHLLERADWELWNLVRASSVFRSPAYGDYTAAHPDPTEIDPRFMQVSASIRYAADKHWVIARGRSLSSPKFGKYTQFTQLSKDLIAHAMFTGKSFSWASDFIEQVASGASTGNLPQWRKVATNRHLVRVAHQIATLP